jgi:glyoxylase-like metal-dependent hydrolase (beta-lactamase superfamily II)
VFDPVRLDARNPGPMTGAGNNTYLLAEPAGAAVLIDAGVGDADHLAELGGHLRSSGAQLRDVLVTHAHGDHAAGAPAIASEHATAAFYKYPWPDADARYPVDWRSLEDGRVIEVAGEQLVALHTPGHSPDHLAFWHEPSRTAFTGDLVVQGSSVMIEASRGGDLGDYLRSLERILTLDARRLLPAHGPEIADAAAVLNGYLAHRALRERQIIGALQSGHATVQSIADYIYDGLAPPLMAAARENVRAHLDKLRKERRASEDAGRWTL